MQMAASARAIRDVDNVLPWSSDAWGSGVNLNGSLPGSRRHGIVNPGPEDLGHPRDQTPAVFVTLSEAKGLLESRG
jgi:hypothetical protein